MILVEFATREAVNMGEWGRKTLLLEKIRIGAGLLEGNRIGREPASGNHPSSQEYSQELRVERVSRDMVGVSECSRVLASGPEWLSQHVPTLVDRQQNVTLRLSSRFERFLRHCKRIKNLHRTCIIDIS